MGLLDNPNFVKWFGQSVVKDRWAKGAPLTLYHGTRNPVFNEFKPGTGGAAGPGIYLAENPDKANVFAGASESRINPGKMNVSSMGGAVYPVHAKIEKPYTLNIYDSEAMDYVKNGGPLRDGYDGIKIPAVSEYVVFNPTQVKSAIGNRGTFDPTDPNILKGLMAPAAAGASLYSPEAAQARQSQDMASQQALQEPSFDPTTLMAGPARWGGGLMNMGADALMKLLGGK